MLHKVKGLTLLQKFLLFLCCILSLSLFDSWYFIKQSQEIEFYDDLDYRLNDLKFSMIKLEYVLDMYVVARHFEQDKVKHIGEDVQKMDRSIQDLEALGYTRFADNAPIMDGIKYMVEDWQLIKNDFSRVGDTTDYDVVLLIHNSVDMNSYLFSEKVEKLLSDINQSRMGIFTDIKFMVAGAVILSILIVLAASSLFLLKGLNPVREVANESASYLAGAPDVNFKESFKGEAGLIAAALNKMSGDVDEAYMLVEEKSHELEADLELMRSQIGALSAIGENAGSSFSQLELYASALKDAVAFVGASSAALYFSAEDAKGGLKLGGYTGLERRLIDEISYLQPGERLLEVDGKNVEARFLDEFPGGFLPGSLRSHGITSVAITSVPYNKDIVGLIIFFFKGDEVFKEESGPFVRALSAFLGAVRGYLGIFYGEHVEKNFLNSIIQQSPIGLAVFDREGVALMLNGALKSMLGISSDNDFVNKYRLFEDNILDGEGLLSILRETYEGQAGEALVDYNPSFLTWYEFNGPPLRLKIRSFPVYDSGGDVNTIALLYEELPMASLNKGAVGSEKGI